MSVKVKPLTFNTIQPTKSLLDDFKKVENILHQASQSHQKRYEIILQFLLAKIFDEHEFENDPDKPLVFQDYKALGVSSEIAHNKMAVLVERAVKYYQRHLPNEISQEITISNETLMQILEVFAPIKITRSKRDVIQTFYMEFAKGMYKWDMAQYFTPTTVTDFLVDLVNPQFGELVADPACGSADFLVAAFRQARKSNHDYAECIWGFDNEDNAVQVAILNMVLNGDGKSKIRKQDSLECVNQHLNEYNIIMCNPPFGSKIIEKREKVLKLFDLGHKWEKNKIGKFEKTKTVLKSQETGVLFLEVCVKECTPGGRIAIVLPNGYLGNTSDKFRLVRQWILRHTRIAAIISRPRFTFKSSGADVSASVLYLEKRLKPLERLEDDSYYRCAVEMIEKVGWDAGTKKASPIYKRRFDDGSLILDDDGNPILDCDFGGTTTRIINSDAGKCFDWLTKNRTLQQVDDCWTVDNTLFYKDKDLTLDPKRYSKKVMTLRDGLIDKPHVLLGDIVDFIPEKVNTKGQKIKANKMAIYNYVEIRKIVQGDYSSEKLRGWELPSRAKHFCEPHDIYFGGVWGSVSKWCYMPENIKDTVVTNGCIRCRIKPGMEDHLADLLAYMNSEGWAVQLRSIARGSDGLAAINIDDAKNVIIPLVNEDVREKLQWFVKNLKEGTSTLNYAIRKMITDHEVDYLDPQKRPSHIVLV